MSPPDDDEELAVFQAALLNLLEQHLAPTEVLRCLRSDPSLAGFHDYIDSFEPRMIEVADALLQKWGRRDCDTSA